MHFDLPTGVTIAYDRHGDPTARPVVLIHGLSGQRETYHAVVEHLVGAGHQVVTVDLRGHGESQHTAIDGYDAPSYTSDVAALIEALELGAVCVAGHSLGGVVAHHLAATRPDLVAAAFLEDPPTFEGDDARRAASPVATIFPQMVAAVRALQAAGAPLEGYRSVVQLSEPDEWDERCRSLSRWDPATMEAALSGITWRGFDPLAPMAVPVTIVRADPAYGAVFLSGDVATMLAANPQMTIIDVPGATHSIHATPTLPAYLAALDAFLAGT